PAVGADGTIYVGSFEPAVSAFDMDGTLKWTYEVGTCCLAGWPATPAVAEDGSIYVGEFVVGPEGQGLMLGLNPDGTPKWEMPLPGIPTSAEIGGDWIIYFGIGFSNPESIYAV